MPRIFTCVGVLWISKALIMESLGQVAARKAMTEGHYVKAATALRRALSYDHTDAALKDALKTAEAQIVHQNEEARKLLLSLRLELREIVECIEKNRERLSLSSASSQH